MKSNQSRPAAAATRESPRLFKTVRCSYCGGEQQIGRDTLRWSCRECKTAHDPAQPES
jgi:hypothetical protein